MEPVPHYPVSAASVLIWVAVAVAIVGRFAWRELRERKVRLRWLFVRPAILWVFALLLLFAASALQRREPVALAVAVTVAIVIGWLAGLGIARYTTLRLPPQPGLVYVRGSYATLAIWLGALAVRVLARFAVDTPDIVVALIANAALVVFLAVATTCVRYQLLVGVRAARARGIVETTQPIATLDAL